MRALLLIDIQQGFDDPFWGARNNPNAETQAAKLLAHWRKNNWPVFHVCHFSKNPDSPLHRDKPGVAINALVTPLEGEKNYEKSVNSAFIGTGLEADLSQAGLRNLVVCGLTTPHCVSTSVRMAANLGFKVTIAHDACAAFTEAADASWRGGGKVDPEAIHNAALDHLNGEFAVIRTVDDILNA